MAGRKVDKNWFLKRLEAQDLSMREFAKKLTNSVGESPDVSRVSRLLSGEATPTPDDFTQYAEFFGVTLDEIFQRFGYRPPKS